MTRDPVSFAERTAAMRARVPRRCPTCRSPWVVCAVREGTIGAFCCGDCNGSHERKADQ